MARRSAKPRTSTSVASPSPTLRAPTLSSGMSAGKAQQWIVLSAIVVGGVYLLRRLVEGASTTSSSSKVASILGAGSPPPLETWILSYGITYLVLAAVAMGAPELAAAFAILVLLVNVINNGNTLAADLGGIEKISYTTQPITAAATSSSGVQVLSSGGAGGTPTRTIVAQPGPNGTEIVRAP